MAFGKQPLTASQVAQFKAQAAAELGRRQHSPLPRVSALQPYIDEEFAELERRFGKDDRLPAIATTLAAFDVLRPGSRAGGVAVIEASTIVDKLDASEAFSDASFAEWSAAVTAPPPKTKGVMPASSSIPFDRALVSALEMYWAFSLTNGRFVAASGGQCARLPSSVFTSGLADGALPRMHGAARFRELPLSPAGPTDLCSVARQGSGRPGRGKKAPRAADEPNTCPSDMTQPRTLHSRYLARDLERGRAQDPFSDPVLADLIGVVAPILKRKIAAGARFERDPVAIVLDWVSRPRRLAKAYKPGVGLHAPRAFLARSFRYDLDDEKCLVGGIVVQTSWVRRQKRDGRLKRDQPLTEDGVEAAQNEARRKMTHRPPAGSMNSTMLAEKLRDRQEGGKLAVALAAAKPGTPEYEDIREKLEDLELWGHVVEWMEEPAPSRPPVPTWAVAGKVGVSSRSVDGLVRAYEAQRAQPFKSEGSSTLIPVREIDLIVAFANRRALTRRR